MREVILRNPEGVARGNMQYYWAHTRGRPASRRATGSLYTGEPRACLSGTSDSVVSSESERNVRQRRRHGGPGLSLSEKEEAMHKEAWKPLSEEEIAEISKVFVPSNTAKNTQWAVGVFTEWRSVRNSAGGAERLCPVDLVSLWKVTGNITHITCYFSHLQSY